MPTDDNPSPYARPQTGELVIERGFLDSQKASLSLRLMNLVLDLVGFVLIALVVTLALWSFVPEITESGRFNRLMGYPAYLAYYVLFEGLTGRTPGKLITGTRVVDRQGNTPGFGAIVWRSLARFIPFEAFSFFRRCGEGWHDTLTYTHVIRTYPSKESA